MPLIEVTAFEERFADNTTSEQLIEALTDAMVAVYGEAVRPETWVILQGVPSTKWGFGGQVRA